MEKVKKILRLLKNRYVLVLTFSFIWITFLDRNNLFNQYEFYSKQKELNKTKDFYLENLQKIDKEKSELDSDLSMLEKFGREKYKIKKTDEDIFLIN